MTGSTTLEDVEPDRQLLSLFPARILLKEELLRTNSSLETARRDSRLGYEWEEDYIYWPESIEKKIQLLKKTLNEEIPAYRRQHKMP